MISYALFPIPSDSAYRILLFPIGICPHTGKLVPAFVTVGGQQRIGKSRLLVDQIKTCRIDRHGI